MTYHKHKMKNAFFILLFTFLIGNVFAHEPLFGLGPHTVGQYAWALESEIERDDDGWTNHYEIIYGITPDIAITAALPYLFSVEGRKGGVGDLVIRGKYRFIRRDAPGASNAFALHGGIKLSTGDQSENRGSGTTDYLIGLSFGHESRRNYAFAGIRYKINGIIGDLNRGDILHINAAYGIRPWQLEYADPDPVFLVEILGQFKGRNYREGNPELNSGGISLGIAPGILFSYRNVMLKAGVKIPIFDKLNGSQPASVREFVFAVDVHMPPFK